MASLSANRSAGLSAALCAQVGKVRHWAFDLDDTLYEPSSGVFREVRNRIAQYVENRLQLSQFEAKELRDQYHKQYGATLGGLIAHHGVVAEEYLGMVHAVSLQTLTPCAERRALLAALPGKRHIFTNSSVAHAERVLRRLNLLDLVDCIFDVAATNWRPKPQQVAYDGFLKRIAATPDEVILFEDSAVNLIPAKALGMATVLIEGEGSPNLERNRAYETAADHCSVDLNHSLRLLLNLVAPQEGVKGVG